MNNDNDEFSERPETPEEVDAYLRSIGYDPDELVKRMRARLLPAIEAAKKRLRLSDDTNEVRK